MIHYDEYGIKIVVEKFGSGGSAFVHEAEALTENKFGLQNGERIAVKEFRDSILELDSSLDRIRQEAHIGETITHERLVKTHGIIETKDQKYALVMEYIEGEELSKWANKQRKDTAWHRWRQICIDICDGVGALHRNGVFHRDIKPENIIISKDRAKVMDIGIACMAEPNEHTMHTEVKDFIGSIRYASPQFLQGDEYCSEDDVYMIGTTLLELLSGKRPYHDTERKVVIPMVMLSALPKADKLREKVPAAIKVLINGTLNRDRNRRPSIDELRSALMDPDNSDYIKKELSRQSTDAVAYSIIGINSGDGGFYADMGSEQLDAYAEYIVVRRESPIHVPSMNSKIEPEMWIADVELRHVVQSVGHFKLIGKRWVESQNSLSKFSFLSAGGRWEEFDKKNESVKVGDIVIKKIGNG